MKNNEFMNEALNQARLAAARGEVPVGAVVVCDDRIVSAAGNRTLELKDPTGHAEILAIREAAKMLDSERLPECDLHVTLEPCAMCAAAISYARIHRLYFGAHDSKSGGVENGVHYFSNSSCHHAPEVYSGFAESECRALLQEFFKKRRG